MDYDLQQKLCELDNRTWSAERRTDTLETRLNNLEGTSRFDTNRIMMTQTNIKNSCEALDTSIKGLLDDLDIVKKKYIELFNELQEIKNIINKS